MKLWTSEHTFNHPWETVVAAAWRKYPNPMNPAVVGIDYLDRKVSPSGSLKTHRLISTHWGLPGWAVRILGADRTCFASEHSEVNPQTKTMTSVSKNITFGNEISIEEKLTYVPNPKEPQTTLMKQEAVITVHGIPLSSYFEEFVANTISSNANKGRLAMEWVIDRIKPELEELTKQTVKSMENISDELKRSASSPNLHQDHQYQYHHFHFQANDL